MHYRLGQHYVRRVGDALCVESRSLDTKTDDEDVARIQAAFFSHGSINPLACLTS